jgi:hypothetical protein
MEMSSAVKQEKPGTSSSNRSGMSVENNKNPAVTQSNQMIAKIYGKSTKFVISSTANSTYINDQYKKPKIQHMKDIIRQKTA